MQVTGYQRVELDGKSFDLVWYGDKARVAVLTKRGLRTLNGRGKANQESLAGRVIAKARTERE